MPIARATFLLVVVINLLTAQVAVAEELLIIANPSVGPIAPLTLRQISAIYLLRMISWPDGSHIIPVNRELGSKARDRFTASVLREDNATLVDYWNKMHFQGKSPPVIQESEQAMLAFVRSVPGAVGYVSASTPVDGVEVLDHVP